MKRPILIPKRPSLLAGLAILLSSACAQTVLVETGATSSAASSASGSGGAASGTGGAVSTSSGATSGGDVGGSGGQPAPPDPVLSSAADSLYETRTDLKIGASGLMVIVWVGHPATAPSYLGYTFSKDHGVTFAPPAQVTSPGGRGAEHPTLVITGNDDVLLSWLGFAGDGSQSPTDTHVYVARAAAGQLTFGAPVEVSAPPGGSGYDRPRLGVTAAGTLIDVYERNGPSEAVIVASRSVDGQTWTQSDLPLDTYFSGTGRRPYPCALVPGSSAGSRFGVGFVGPDYGGSSFGVGLLLSDDDGLTWNGDTFYADAASVSGPRCATSGNSYWLAYGFGSDTSGVNLLPMEDETVVVRYPGFGDQLNQQTFQAYLLNPELVVDAAGNVDLAYYTGQVDGDPGAAYRITHPDGTPVTASAGTIVHQPVTFALSSPASSSWLGDYTGLATQGDLLATSYIDNSSGASHVAFHRMTIPTN